MIVPNYRLWLALAVCVAVGASLLAWREARAAKLGAELLRTLPEDIERHPDLVSFAASEAKPVYADKCASCHGADMKGNTRLGAPDLSDKVWLYGTGNVTDIERTILYGIRSGNGKAHNVTEMTAFGLSGMLNDGEIKDVVQYVLSLSHRPNLAEAAIAGHAIFSGKGLCYDCHSADGRGDSDYGSTNLTLNVWNNGGDPASLYHSIYYGVSHVCPAWIGIIPLEKIRALAVYLHSVSEPETAAYAPRQS